MSAGKPFRLFRRYAKLFKILDERNIYKLRIHLANRKGYFYNFMKTVNKNYSLYLRLHQYLSNIFILQQTESNIIYLIELFYDYKVQDLLEYCFTSFKYEQFNNVRILIENYPDYFLDAKPNIYEYFIFKNQNTNYTYESRLGIGEYLENTKIVYYIIKNLGRLDLVQGLKLNNFVFPYVARYIGWYDNLHPFTLEDVRMNFEKPNHTLPSFKLLKKLEIEKKNHMIMQMLNARPTDNNLMFRDLPLFESQVLKLIVSY